MVKTAETFQTTLKDIRQFLSEKRMLSDLAKNAETSVRLVHETFSAKEFTELKGKKLTIYQKAIEMVETIKSLPQKAKDAIESDEQ